MLCQPLTLIICFCAIQTAYSKKGLALKAFNAVKTGNSKQLETLLEEHSSEISSFVNIRQDGSGQTPLMMSVLMGQTECVKVLLSHPEVDVTVPEKDG